MKNPFPRRGEASYYTKMRKWADGVSAELEKSQKAVRALEKRLEKLEKPAKPAGKPKVQPATDSAEETTPEV